MHGNIVNASRVLMGDSLGFHILILMFGLTLPILCIWFEYLSKKRNDEKLLNLAKLWSKVMTILVIAGVMSGTVVALQFSLVWPGILKFGGQVIGLPFLFESYAFIIEAVFLALYMYTWNKEKISRNLHMFFGSMVVLGGTLSAFSITTVNAWMNLPKGFDIVGGKLENIQVWKAMFSDTAIIEFAHSMLGYYLAVIMVMASIYAIKLRKERVMDRQRSVNFFVVKKMIILSGILILLSIITGSISAKYLANNEPIKLAQIEAVTKSGAHSSYVFGGILDSNGKLVGPRIVIPNALSLLVGESPNTFVKGLDVVPLSNRPPSYIHSLFDIKMTMVGILSLVIFVFIYGVYKKSKFILKDNYLKILILVGFFGLVIVELGWMLTEIGRQPWAINGYLKTQDAITKTNNITSYGYIFPFFFVILFIVTYLAVRRVTRDPKGN